MRIFKLRGWRRGTLKILALAALFLAAVLIRGDGPMSRSIRIRLGERRSGALLQSDRIRLEPPRGRQSRMIFNGTAGQKITVIGQSYEFPVFLILTGPNGAELGWSDDGDGLFGARISTELPDSGRYTVSVCAEGSSQYGTFWISVEEGRRGADLSHAAVRAYYDNGMEWALRVGNKRAASWLSLRMGKYLSGTGRRAEADQFYSDSLVHSRSCGWYYAEICAQLERARSMRRRLRYSEAADELQAALETSSRLNEDDAGARVLMELSRVYADTRQDDLAQLYISRAAQLAERSGLASTLVRLYTALNENEKTHDRAEAIKYAERAAALSEGVEPELALEAKAALAGTHMFLEPGRLEEGLSLAEEAIERARKLGFPDLEISLLTLQGMGYYKQNKIDRVIDLAGHAVDLTEPEDESHESLRIALQLQADGEMLKGNNRKALDLCLKALYTLERDWSKEPIQDIRRVLLSESEAICTQIIRNLYALNARRPRQEYSLEAFDFAERSRSRALLDELANVQSADRMALAPELRERDRQLLKEISDLGARMALLRWEGSRDSGEVPRMEQHRAELLAERMRLQLETRSATASTYNAAVLSPLSAEQVQSGFLAAHPNTVVLFYQLGIQEDFLIVLERRHARMVKLVDKPVIAKAMTDWRKNILAQLATPTPEREAIDRYNEASRRLYEMLIKPAARFIRGRDLVIVPCAPIFDLAFEALVVNAADNKRVRRRARFLLEDHPVSYAPSISALAALDDRRRQPGNDILLIGGEGAGRQTAEPQRPEAPGVKSRSADNPYYLPGARNEIQEIAALGREQGLGTTVWSGPGADTLLNSNLSTFRIMHVAAHSFADYRDGYFSALELSFPDQDNKGTVLTSYQISTMKLNADLVVLSGCETGVGQNAGAEGIVGLTRSFLVAGARGVCASLWPVQDIATEKLMRAFYSRLLTHRLDTSHALRESKLTMLRSGAAPCQWAPFTLTGLSFRILSK